MKRLIRAASFLIPTIICLTGIGLYIAVYHVLPYSPIRPHRCTHEEIAHYFPDGFTPSDLGMKGERLDVTVEDTIILKGWFIHAKSVPPLGTIILLHGSASCKEAMLPTARRFSQNGFNAIVFDLRAHGESGGMNCTYGYYEKHDVSTIIDEAIKVYPGAAPFGIYGNSLGGAVALQVMAEDERIKCGVVESSFATLREVIFDYMKRLTFIPFRSVSDKILELSSDIAHFPIDSVRPEESAKRIHQPILLTHGTADSYISIEYGRRIFANLASTDKTWYPVEGGDHNNLLVAAGHVYQLRVIEFLKSNLTKGM